MKVTKDKRSIVVMFEDEDIAKIVTWINYHKNSIEYGKLSSTPSVTEREVIYNNEENNFDIVFDKTFYKSGDDRDKLILSISTIDNNDRSSNIIFTSELDTSKPVMGLEHYIKYYIKRSIFLQYIKRDYHSKAIKVQNNFKN